MPHIIIEYSHNSVKDIPVLMLGLNNALSTHDTVNKADIKTRAIQLQDSFLGEDNDPNDMVHIELKLLPGRNDDMRKDMAMTLLETAKNHITNDTVSVRVETSELHAASYSL